VWTPLGDCDAELGGLAIARGSNRRGLLEDGGVRSWQLLDDSTEWIWNPFKCGDVVMFHSLTIHRGRDNVTEDRIRLATSARYQSVNEPVDEDALTVHLGCAKWEEVYSEWETDDSLKYYWNAIDMNVEPAYHRRRRKSADG
jgi:ectoine hydroxylase-related dioxygenase (phytanoyl-CoA dioxygenase family)